MHTRLHMEAGIKLRPRLDHAGMMGLTSQQFERTRKLALELAGIELYDRHREVLARRIRRLGLRDDSGLNAILDGASRGETTATEQLICLLTTKFTGFFRHPAHFEIAAEHALKAVRQRGRACLWSAAAATGEEPYSLAMALIQAFDRDDPPVSILATDLDAKALALASKGEYAEFALRTVPPASRERFFRQAEGADRWTVVPVAQRLVVFRQLNLVSLDWPVDGLFDVIFCRNLLMYLETRRRGSILGRMAGLLAPDGLLMLDPAECPGPGGDRFEVVAEGVYRRRLGPNGQSPAAPKAKTPINRGSL